MHEIINLLQGSQPQHYWNWRLHHTFLFAPLCITGWIAVSPASTHHIPGEMPVMIIKKVSRQGQIPPGGQCHPCVRTTQQDNVKSRCKSRDLTEDTLPC